MTNSTDKIPSEHIISEDISNKQIISTGYKIALMGATSVGKTTFIGSYFYYTHGGFKIDNLKYNISVTDPNSSDYIFDHIINTIFEKHKLVEGTQQKQNITFNVSQIETGRLMGQFTLTDVPGGWTTDMKGWQDKAKGYITDSLKDADGVIFFIPCDNLFENKFEGKILKETAVYIAALEHIKTGKLNKKADTPICVIFTKGDKFEEYKQNNKTEVDQYKSDEEFFKAKINTFVGRLSQEIKTDIPFYKKGHNVNFFVSIPIGKWKNDNEVPSVDEMNPKNLIEPFEWLFENIVYEKKRYNKYINFVIIALIIIPLILNFTYYNLKVGYAIKKVDYYLNSKNYKAADETIESLKSSWHRYLIPSVFHRDKELSDISNAILSDHSDYEFKKIEGLISNAKTDDLKKLMNSTYYNDYIKQLKNYLELEKISIKITPDRTRNVQEAIGHFEMLSTISLLNEANNIDINLDRIESVLKAISNQSNEIKLILENHFKDKINIAMDNFKKDKIQNLLNISGDNDEANINSIITNIESIISKLKSFKSYNPSDDLYSKFFNPYIDSLSTDEINFRDKLYNIWNNQTTKNGMTEIEKIEFWIQKKNTSKVSPKIINEITQTINTIAATLVDKTINQALNNKSLGNIETIITNIKEVKDAILKNQIDVSLIDKLNDCENSIIIDLLKEMISKSALTEMSSIDEIIKICDDFLIQINKPIYEKYRDSIKEQYFNEVITKHLDSVIKVQVNKINSRCEEKDFKNASDILNKFEIEIKTFLVFIDNKFNSSMSTIIKNDVFNTKFASIKLNTFNLNKNYLKNKFKDLSTTSTISRTMVQNLIEDLNNCNANYSQNDPEISEVIKYLEYIKDGVQIALSINVYMLYNRYLRDFNIIITDNKGNKITYPAVSWVNNSYKCSTTFNVQWNYYSFNEYYIEITDETWLNTSEKFNILYSNSMKSYTNLNNFSGSSNSFKVYVTSQHNIPSCPW